MRNVPEPLYGDVLRLSLAIVNASEREDAPKARGALRQLRGLYRSKRNSPDPFLTEALADFTGGARAASKLYRLAIQQSLAFPGEPIFTKQAGLASRLIELGYSSEAARLLSEAKPAAQAAGDEAILAELCEVEHSIASV